MDSDLIGSGDERAEAHDVQDCLECALNRRARALYSLGLLN